MIPLPEYPRVVIRVDSKGNVLAVASNISADLKVLTCLTDVQYKYDAANKPFDTTRPTVEKTRSLENKP